jgi:HEAT repeat protein
MVSSPALSERELDHEKPQQQAEILLTRAVSRAEGAANQNEGRSRAQTEAQTVAQIQARIEGWRGKLEWNPQLSQLTTAALNSDDENVRTSAIEVQLAAYGLKKNDSTVDALVRQADAYNHKERIWAMWTLGLLGNRGVETDRVVQVLTAHLQGSGKGSATDRELDDEDARHWAVEGLALVGTTSTIAPLLEAMHNDPSPLVRESAACSLARSGMLTHERRLTAVPQLIIYSDDPALDAQTHAWVFQALTDITGQHLPNQSEAWKQWYRETVVSGR